MRYIVQHAQLSSEPGNLAADALAREINRCAKDAGIDEDPAAVREAMKAALPSSVIASWGMEVVEFPEG